MAKKTGMPDCNNYRQANCRFRENGRCKILDDTSFGARPCPFYKPMTTEEMEERKEALSSVWKRIRK